MMRDPSIMKSHNKVFEWSVLRTTNNIRKLILISHSTNESEKIDYSIVKMQWVALFIVGHSLF